MGSLDKLLRHEAIIWPLGAALTCLKIGWHPTPLCWPHVSGNCECRSGLDRRGRVHRYKDVGKAPIQGVGYQTKLLDEASVRRYWSRWPMANVGLLLEPSKLVVVDLDNKEAIAEAKKLGLGDTLVVETGKGRHYYYSRPEDYPIGRVTQKGKSKGIDLLSRGYSVAPPSVHRTGVVYHWSGVPTGDLPEPPWWTRDFFPKKRKSWLLSTKEMKVRSRRVHFTKDPNTSDVDRIQTALSYLDPDDYDLWRNVGFALAAWDDSGDGRGRGFDVWETWSRRNEKYTSYKDLQIKWRSFKGGSVTLGTVFEEAKKAGWVSVDPFQVQRASGGGWAKGRV